MNLRPPLQNEHAILLPLREIDFEVMHAVASDPLIWEQHPNKDRWKRDVFRNFFDGAMQSNGAYKVIDAATAEVAGCTRVYDYDSDARKALVGYTFYARKFWGSGLNHKVKAMMLDHLFSLVDVVEFHIGAENRRSQISIERLGARKVGEMDVAYYGEPTKLNCVYQITRGDWKNR